MQKFLISFIIALFLSQAYAQTCSAGQYANNGTCVACPTGAATCTAANVFTSCSSNGWFATNISATTVGCSQCNLNTTATCQSPILALTCQNGYTLVGGQCVPCAADSSAACQSTCTSAGFVSVGSTCQACLNSTAQCLSGCAAQGFYSLGNSCRKCPKGATACNANLATACAAGFFLGPQGICTQCPQGQATCSVQSVATSCYPGYYLNNNNVCTLCATSTTAACPQACLAVGYYSKGNTCNACGVNADEACESVCHQFGLYTASVTTTAEDGTTSTAQSCNLCEDGASQCTQQNEDEATPSTATECFPGYYLDASNDQGQAVCSPCTGFETSNQVTCNSVAVATSCQDGYFLNQTSCVTCASETSACDQHCLTSGYYTLNETCVACATGASSCVDEEESTGCFFGYYLTGPTCVTVPSGVVYSADPVTTTPAVGYYLVNGVPKECSVGQATCTEPTDVSNGLTIADTCLDGFTLNSDMAQCIPLPKGALTGTSPVATSCIAGYYLSGGVCSACDDASNADGCSSGDTGKAIGCNDGYFLSSGACSACGSNAYTCISNAIATNCEVGYYVEVPYTGSSACTQYANTPDAVASLRTAAAAGRGLTDETADACTAGYFLKADKSECIKCGEHAYSCTSATVIASCETGYNLINNFCFPCEQNSASKSCQTTDSYVITSVTCTAGAAPTQANPTGTQGYFLSDINTCSSCDTAANFDSAPAFTISSATNILTCSGSATVGVPGTKLQWGFTCKPGYVPYKQTDGTIAGCLSCAGYSTDGSGTVTHASLGDIQDDHGFFSCTAPSAIADVTANSVTLTPTAVVCLQGSAPTQANPLGVQGWFLSAANECSSCGLAASFDSAPLLSISTATNILTCSGASSGAGNTLQWGYKCKAGYVPYKESDNLIAGCLSCAGYSTDGSGTVTHASLGTIQDDHGFFSCTAPAGVADITANSVTLTPTNVVCLTGSAATQASPAGVQGWFLSAANECSSCGLAASFATAPALAISGNTNILTCSGASSGAGNTLQWGFKCQAGYVPYKESDNLIVGCLSCAGYSTDGSGTVTHASLGTVQTNHGFFSCTAPTAVADVTANSVTLTPTAVVCLQGSAPTQASPVGVQGWFLSAANECSSCGLAASFSALPLVDATTAADSNILTCSGAASGHGNDLQWGFTCKAGYVPYKLSDNTVQGCLSCDGLASASANTATNANIFSCTAPTSSASLSDAYTAQSDDVPVLPAGIVCAAGYYFNGQLAGSTPCTAVSNAEAIVSTAISGCADGYYLSTSTGKCVACGTGIATCQSPAASVVALTCETLYYLTLDTCTLCQSDSKAATCNGAKAYAETCDDGYVLVNGQCFACPENALTCSGLKALTCASGYFVSEGACAECGSNALTCTSNSVALTCEKGYFLSSGSCTACGSNALTCTSASAALTCEPGYFLSSGSCNACGSNALTCTSASAALTCEKGYFLSSGSCSACGTNAATCSSNSVALTCNAGYVLVSGNCNTACPQGAATCSSGTVSTTCKTGFYLTSQQCRACQQFAATCTNYNTPLTCITGYTLNSGKCVKCPGGASACSSPSVATTCLSGFSLQNGACVACGDNTLTCSGTYALTCVSGYFASNGACVACGTGASECTSATVATSCKDGYFLSSSACVACGNNAKECTSATVATSCKDGYFLNNNACSACGTGAVTCTSASAALTCTTGYFLVSNACVKCPANADECSSTTVATSCVSGYVLVGTQCVQCLIGSDVCSAPVITCQDGYVEVNNVCTACASTTATCASGCNALGFFSGASSCSRCDPNASSCSSATAAAGCNDGYYLSSTNTCTACPTGAATCEAPTTGNTGITACTDGYFSEGTTPNITCTSCGTGAHSCLSVDQALSCHTGYYLNSLGVCTECTNENAVSCALYGFATNCASGYYPLNGVCVACASTSSACQPECLSLGFFTQTTTTGSVTTLSCSACGSNALSCNSASVATSCDYGYYLDGKAQCTACAANTAECPLRTTMTSCSVGYTNVNGTCVQCPAGFATCTSATNGTACLPGFFLSTPWTTCTRCPSPSATCSSADVYTSCLPTFYATPIQGFQVSCTACPTANNVVECYNATYATRCQVGFSPVNGVCGECPTNAQSCNGQVIITCKVGFYLVNNTCQACGTGAASCVNNVTALTCKPGYGFSAGNCTKCASGFSSCDAGKQAQCFAGFEYKDGACSCAAGSAPTVDGTACGTCPTNCVSCSSPSSCTTCKAGFTLQSNGSCAYICGAGQYVSYTSTPSNGASNGASNGTSNGTAGASNATSNGTSNATQNGSFVNAGSRMLQSCVACPASCGNCTSATVCQSCASGFSLRASDSTCQPNFAGKLFGNVFMMIAVFLGLALVIKQ